MKRFFSTPLTLKFLQAFVGSDVKGVSVRILKQHHVSEKTRARVSNGEVIRLPQFYNVFRFALLSKRTRWEKLKLVMQLMDQLEQDYHSVYPEDPPVLEEGFEKALHQMVTK